MYNFMSYVIAESDILELMVIKLHNTFIQSWWHDSQCNERARGAFVHDGLELPSSCKREFIVIARCFSIAQTNWTFQRHKTFYWGSAIKLCSTYWKNRDMNFDGWIVSDFFYSSWSEILDTEWEEDLHMMTTDLELLGSHFEMIEAFGGPWN